ncbi:MAG TPA: M14 family zinc carboxypeptidase [Rhodocyclaceae bacterium]|nr:M14 family zinc carboxypeptidase [Rhodocyclaceae bacterium]
MAARLQYPEAFDSHSDDVPKPSELAELEQVIREAGSLIEVTVASEVESREGRLPIYSIAIGRSGTDVPGVGFFGGIHGLERIGAEVVIAYLRSVIRSLRWDDDLSRKLESLRLIFMPIVNPGGLERGTRANPRGVDLMRNAPLDATEPVPFLVGGQRLTPSLPWFRGYAGQPMETESLAVCDIVERELLSRPFALALDCHSGFGMKDRIWFPYARTAAPIPHLAEMHAIKQIFDQSYVHHDYTFEPQSRHYLAHGDLWDYLYEKSVARGLGVFLPLTLELGSWLWVKKNPRQLFSRHGIFNPLIRHRQERVLRRHLSWLEFLTRAARSYKRWLPVDSEHSAQCTAAMELWYAGGKP